ncbi:MAG TPA: putative toxin-antitoxin system toxin component, PIN family [Stellaceae bacterium]|nr:putative toxin-antitoxin system toxin component, PIN family [Stellaceae bacterium]
MRVILDTNVLLSALIRRNSVPGRILEGWFDDRFILITHALQLEELRVVTRRQQIRALIRPSEAGRLVNQLRADAELMSRLPHTRRSEDPADDFLLALSEAGSADHLVTGDKAGLLRLGRHGATIIQNARDFLDRLTR